MAARLTRAPELPARHAPHTVSQVQPRSPNAFSRPYGYGATRILRFSVDICRARRHGQRAEPAPAGALPAARPPHLAARR
eukprot:1299849-Rhodomonas_salina.1